MNNLRAVSPTNVSEEALAGSSRTEEEPCLRGACAKQGPVTALLGVGKKTAHVLASIGVSTLAELSQCDKVLFDAIASPGVTAATLDKVKLA